MDLRQALDDRLVELVDAGDVRGRVDDQSRDEAPLRFDNGGRVGTEAEPSPSSRWTIVTRLISRAASDVPFIM